MIQLTWPNFAPDLPTFEFGTGKDEYCFKLLSFFGNRLDYCRILPKYTKINRKGQRKSLLALSWVPPYFSSCSKLVYLPETLFQYFSIITQKIVDHSFSNGCSEHGSNVLGFFYW